MQTGFVHLQRMAEDPNKKRLTFQGERTRWITPVTLNDLLELRTNFPKAPLIMGNTTVGRWSLHMLFSLDSLT
jgi:aldehyde oxidase